MKNGIYFLIKSIYRYIKMKFNNYRISVTLVGSFICDIAEYTQYSKSIQPQNTRDKEIAAIMLLYHSLEKGLSLDQPRDNFGLAKAIQLLDITAKYQNKYGKDILISTSFSVLNEYIDVLTLDNELAVRFKSEFQKISKESNFSSNSLGGTKVISVASIDYEKDYFDFVLSRHSIRSYSLNKHISNEEIEKAVKIAQTAPSACNRQASRIRVYNHGTFNEILDNQLGDQGWASAADKLFIITSNLNYFGGVFERKQAFIDGGLFSMQFVLGLHSQKIASCCKMYIRSPKIDKKFYKLTNIPRNEVPIMFILAGHYKDNMIKVPCSKRLEMDKILTYT